MKKHIVKIGYNYFLAKDAQEAVQFLGLEELSREYIDGKEIYSPTNNKELSVILVDEEDIRPVTREERENKELSEAKTRAQWANNRATDLEKQVNDLKCKLKVLMEDKETVDPE